VDGRAVVSPGLTYLADTELSGLSSEWLPSRALVNIP